MARKRIVQRISEKVSVEGMVNQIDQKTDNFRSIFNELIVPVANRYMEQGYDWAKSVKFAKKELALFSGYELSALNSMFPNQYFAV